MTTLAGLRQRVDAVGLRWRFAAWVGVVVLICTGITFVAVYRGTGTQLRHQIDQEIAGDAGELSHTLTSSQDSSPSQVARAANSYVRTQPFSASSTLLFVIVPGVGTSTNRPELFAGASADNGETPAAQAQENRLAHQLVSARDGYSTLSLPDVGDLRLLKRTVSIPAEHRSRIGQQLSDRVVIGVGEPLLTVAHAQSGVARAFILASILTLASALLAAYLIGTRVSRPLRRIAAVAAQVDAGDLHPRIHEPDSHGGEVRVLSHAFNHMLDRLTDAFAGQRAFVADASHELRTPLTVIAGQLEVLASQRQPSGDEVRRVERLVRAEIARTSRLVDDLLLLAKAEQTQLLRIEPIDLEPYVHELWDGTSLLANRRFELAPSRAGPCEPTPIASHRHCATCSATPSHTRLPARGWCAWQSSVRAQIACGSWSKTTVRASHQINASASLTASTAPTRPVTAPLADRGLGWRSCARSRRPMTGASLWDSDAETAQRSNLNFHVSLPASVR